MAKVSKKWLAGGLPACASALALVLGCGDAVAQGKTRLTVYTAIENEQLQPYKQAFEADNPNIEIAWVRDRRASSPRACWRRRKIRAPT